MLEPVFHILHAQLVNLLRFFYKIRYMRKKRNLNLLSSDFEIVIFQVTNDIFTKEDGEFLVKHGALPEERIRAVETGGCPHAAIREDISINLGPLEELSNLFKADILLCESGGGNFTKDD